MKKIILLTCMLISAIMMAQGSQKEVDLSVKVSTLIEQIKSNELFSFIGTPPLKMFEIYDCDGGLDHYAVKGVDYTIEFINSNVIVAYQGNKFFLTMVNKDFVGHGSTLDTRTKKMITYYFQNDKIIKKSVTNYGD